MVHEEPLELIGLLYSSTIVTLIEVCAPALSPVAVKMIWTESPTTKVLVEGRLVSATKAAEVTRGEIDKSMKNKIV